MGRIPKQWQRNKPSGKGTREASQKAQLRYDSTKISW
jgi:hypothetical protein